MKLLQVVVLTIGLGVLSACGGGPSSSGISSSSASISSSSSSTAVNTAPAVSNVRIVDDNAGSTLVGDTLIGSYTFTDAEGDAEGASTFRWFRGSEAIANATSMTYELTSADSGQPVGFEVTPIAATGEIAGAAEVSENLNINTRRLLNDTGIVTCGDHAEISADWDYQNNGLDCAALGVSQTTDGVDTDGDIVPAGQDALYGRDVTHNDNSDGHAGFSYTQLDSNGDPLATKSTDYATTPWSCVKDNVTGLLWEVKTLSGLQTFQYVYTWYNSTSVNNGGNRGIGDTGVGTTTSNYEGSDNCENTDRCDTEKYVADVNAANLCGANDWRLPNKAELASLVNSGATSSAIDEAYFPNTFSAWYWSSSPTVGSYDVSCVHFKYGSVHHRCGKDDGRYVRLVRGSE